MDHCSSKERVSLLPTKLEPAAKDRACRSAHAALETQEERCWVCLEGEEGGPLVQLCACRGTNTWAHKHCVDEWRRTSPREDAAYRCGTCKDHYRDALSLELLSARLQAERANGGSTGFTLNTLASELRDQGKFDEAEPLFREALEVRRATLGTRHPNRLASINNLGTLLYAKGKYAAAEPLFREALEVTRATLGNRHPHTLTSINNLGALLKAKGDLDAAEPLYREALGVQRETLGNRHPHTLSSINNLGLLLKAKGDLDAAEPLYREALEVRRATLGNRHPNTLTSINNLSVLLQDKGDLDAAEPLFREALEVWRATLGNRHPNTLTCVNNLGQLLQDKGDLDAAEPLCREAHSRGGARRSAIGTRTRSAPSATSARCCMPRATWAPRGGCYARPVRSGCG